MAGRSGHMRDTASITKGRLTLPIAATRIWEKEYTDKTPEENRVDIRFLGNAVVVFKTHQKSLRKKMRDIQDVEDSLTEIIQVLRLERQILNRRREERNELLADFNKQKEAQQ